MTYTDEPARLNRLDAGALELLLTRRSGSAKAMTGPGPDDGQLAAILRAASRVPDHGKLAPWRFLVFRGEARVRFGEVLGDAFAAANPQAIPELVESERRRFLRAPVVVGVVSRARAGLPIPEWEQILSAGAACQTLLIAAHASGFVGGWVTEWYAYDANVRQALGLEPHERMAGFIYLGTSAKALEDRPRPALDAIATDWTG